MFLDMKENPFKNARIIAVGSGKGGVGKSSVTAGIAVALAREGYRVGLIDADILGHSIPQIMGTKYEEPDVNDESLLMPVEKHGVKIISMGNLIETNEAFIWRGPMLAKALNQFIYDVYWGELDYMLIDMPPGTGDVPLNIMQSELEIGILIVTTPQGFASGIAKRLGLMAEKAGARVIGIVENMSYFICDNCGKKHFLFGKSESGELCKELGATMLGSIPIVPVSDEKDDENLLLSERNPELAAAFKGIAEKLRSIYK